jgi:hypothetical protein
MRHDATMVGLTGVLALAGCMQRAGQDDWLRAVVAQNAAVQAAHAAEPPPTAEEWQGLEADVLVLVVDAAGDGAALHQSWRVDDVVGPDVAVDVDAGRCYHVAVTARSPGVAMIRATPSSPAVNRLVTSVKRAVPGSIEICADADGVFHVGIDDVAERIPERELRARDEACARERARRNWNAAACQPQLPVSVTPRPTFAAVAVAVVDETDEHRLRRAAEEDVAVAAAEREAAWRHASQAREACNRSYDRCTPDRMDGSPSALERYMRCQERRNQCLAAAR